MNSNATFIQAAPDVVHAANAMIDVRDLHVTFTRANKTIQAVNGVSLAVKQGEALALIGESGSGKSVTLRALMRLHPAAQTKIQGLIEIGGHDVLGMSEKEVQKFRGKQAAMIFQEPLLALDPVYTVGQQIIECIRRHKPVSKADARQIALRALEAVRIPSPEKRLASYPHEMSGGMRQRAMIALALCADPQVLLADEPTTALDATVQIQVLILMRDLQKKLGLSIIFVTHDIGAAVEIADRVAVMYGGRIVEEGTIGSIMKDARHPYTKALLKSRQHGMARGKPLDVISGSPPDLSNLPGGCTFAPRCAFANGQCQSNIPERRQVGSHHFVSCFLVS